MKVPRLAHFTAADRLVVSVKAQGESVRVVVLALVFGAGRDAVSLIVTGLRSDLSSLEKLQLRLAHKLAKRFH